MQIDFNMMLISSTFLYRCLAAAVCIFVTVIVLYSNSLAVIHLSINSFEYMRLFDNNTARKENDFCAKRTFNSSVEDILCMTPFDYSKEFKNPCWRTDGMQLRCLPYFMLIGMDKSGSTDVFSRIIKHPDILGNDISSSGDANSKETKWWSWTRYGLWLVGKIKRQYLSHYIKHFDKAAVHINNTLDKHGHHDLITGDGTPMDMWDFRGWPDIPQNWNKTEPVALTPHLIKHLLPDTKFIIILRDPVERLYSDYFFIRLGHPSSEGFDKAVRSSIGILNNCTLTNSLRKCLYDKNLHIKWDYRARLHLGFYSVYLKEWLKVFPRRQFFIFRTEDYSKNTFEYMSQIFNFLDVGFLDEKQMEPYGILSKKHAHRTRGKQKVGPMSDESRKILTDLYQPYNNELARILSDRRYLWDDSF